MPVFPGGREVDQALKGTERQVKLAVKKVNQQAAKVLARGRYDEAQALVEAAKGVKQFQVEVAALRAKWKALAASARRTGRPARKETTPLWEYYRPILKTLVQLGGQSTRREIESGIKPHLDSFLKPGDYDPVPSGKPRWIVRVGWARRAMVKEGYLKNVTGGRWVITAAGRKMAGEG